MFKKVFSTILIIVIVSVVIAGGALAWQYWPKPVEEGQIEPDQPVVDEGANESNEITDWQTYLNEEYGFEFKYPSNFKILSDSPTNYSKDNGICAIVHEVGLINSALPQKCWEADSRSCKVVESLVFLYV